MTRKTKRNKWGINAITAPVRWILVTGMVYCIATGKIDIPSAWLYNSAYLVGAVAGSMLLLKKVPELLNQRGKIQAGTKKWDKIVIISYFLFATSVTPLVAGLDDRFEIFLLPFAFLYLGLGLYGISVIFVTWPMLHNPFFVGTVRIQQDRGHTVVSTGPCALVRHAGYWGMLVGSLTIPHALGSVLSFVPATVMIVLVFVRTYFEHKTLRKAWEGYKVYCQAVKHRLIPWVMVRKYNSAID